MRKKQFSIAIILATAVLSVFIAATPLPDQSSFITHNVKKGETVSLLCIELYGYYSQELGAAFAKDNPTVKNINVIYVNQKLLFRKPIAETAAKTDSVKADTTAQVFRKKVDATQGVVTYVEGRAQLKKKDSATLEKLTANVVVVPGDVIKTGSNGRVELIINRESVVRLKENTELTIEALRDLKKDEGKTAINFSVGSLWAKVKKFKDKISRFELEMPTAVAGVHGTIYQTTVHRDSSAEVKVYDGEVSVSGKSAPSDPSTAKRKLYQAPHEVSGPHQVSMEQWVMIVRSMQAIKINKNGVPTDTAAFKRAPKDSWENWNEERDRRISEMFAEN